MGLKRSRRDLGKSCKREKWFSAIFNTTYSTKSHRLKSIFLKHWQILKTDPELMGVFKDPPWPPHTQKGSEL